MFGGAYFGQIYFAGQVLWGGGPTPPPPPPVPIVVVVSLPDHTGGRTYRRNEADWQELLTERVRTIALARNEQDMSDIISLVKLALEELCR